MARPESGECLLDCHEDTGGGGEGEGGPEEGGKMDTLGQRRFVNYRDFYNYFF